MDHLITKDDEKYRVYRPVYMVKLENGDMLLFGATLNDGQYSVSRMGRSEFNKIRDAILDMTEDDTTKKMSANDLEKSGYGIGQSCVQTWDPKIESVVSVMDN